MDVATVMITDRATVMSTGLVGPAGPAGLLPLNLDGGNARTTYSGLVDVDEGYAAAVYGGVEPIDCGSA